MIVRSLAEAEAFTTADGSTIRELLGLPTAPVQNQSLAEATLAPGPVDPAALPRARPRRSTTSSRAAARWSSTATAARIGVGDAVLIPPGAWHEITAGDDGCRFLCCCAPAYRHEDTFFDR